MTTSTCVPILAVLSNHPEVYRTALEPAGFTIRCLADVPAFLDMLGAATDIRGMVLDIGLVMRSPRRQRDHIFSFAARLPFLRSKVSEDGKVSFSDTLESFGKACASCTPMGYRAAPRVPVALNAELSFDDDPAMSRSAKVNILDISIGGCFVSTIDPSAFADFAHLRVLELKNRLPILVNVRWRREWGRPYALPGLGLRFVSPAEDQLAEIRGRLIEPALGRDLGGV